MMTIHLARPVSVTLAGARLVLGAVLAVAAAGCDDGGDGQTLASVFGTDTGRFVPSDVGSMDVVDMVDVSDTSRPPPDVVLAIPDGACATMSIEVDGVVVRNPPAVRCEVSRQTWRNASTGDSYLTIVLETEVTPTADGTGYARDLVQIVLDSAASTGSITPGVYPLTYDTEVADQLNFAVFSERTGQVASTGESVEAWGQMRGQVVLLDGDGLRGRYELEATDGPTRYRVRGDFEATPAAGRLPEPSVR